MGFTLRSLGWLALLTVLVVVGASTWFWFLPVGVNNYINKISVQILTDSPELLTGLGMIDNTPLDFHSGKLSDYTKASDLKQLAKLRRMREGLDRYGPKELTGQELISWRIMVWFVDNLIRQTEFEHGGYRVNQLGGITLEIPQLLTDQHVISSEKSVKRYISRINEFGRVLGEVKTRVEDDHEHGITPPDFIIEKALGGMRAFIEGGAESNPLVTTLPEKLQEIGLSDEDQADYLAVARQAVATSVIPGYQAMIKLFEELLQTADHAAGIWRIPEGKAIYAAALKSNTTTDLSAEQIHDTGLAEVQRIETEMEAILVDQELTEGSMATRIRQLMEDPTQQFPNTDDGRQAMIDYLETLNDEVMAIAGDYFITLPPQPLEVTRVPVYSQDSSPGGYYMPPALDGSRPGRFYINQKDTAGNPQWTLPTFIVHEGSPGHHFQLSLAHLITGVPVVRKVLPFTAYAEGWALYAERIAKTDMGLYDDDPLGDLGRLQAEMFRAVRLVVDTGMHAKRWSRERAIEYMISKTGMTEAEVTREIERYVVWPGQATAYKTGQLALLDMRGDAETTLGDKFDLREFHETLLMNGAMPLDILGGVVKDWVAATKAN